MLVKIKLDGPYSDFGTPGRIRAQQLKAGDEVDLPAEYAKGLIESGLAEDVSKVTKRLQEPVSARAEEEPTPSEEEEPADDGKAQTTGRGKKRSR